MQFHMVAVMQKYFKSDGMNGKITYNTTSIICYGCLSLIQKIGLRYFMAYATRAPGVYNVPGEEDKPGVADDPYHEPARGTL